VDAATPLVIGACDSGATLDRTRLSELIRSDDWDVLVWGVRGHPPARRRPEHYGWIGAAPDGTVAHVSVKKPLGDPARDPIITGAFMFRRTSDFRACAQRLFERDARVNGEFYVDSCINDAVALGLRCRLFEIDHLLCWGTPDELRTFEYWQSCFDKWSGHPYRLELDRRVAPGQLARLREGYGAFTPARPTPRP
jgi:hypothetical protein